MLTYQYAVSDISKNLKTNTGGPLTGTKYFSNDQIHHSNLFLCTQSCHFQVSILFLKFFHTLLKFAIGLPGVFIAYELSPFMVEKREKAVPYSLFFGFDDFQNQNVFFTPSMMVLLLSSIRTKCINRFTHFLASSVAILGGVFSVAVLMNGLLLNAFPASKNNRAVYS